MDGNIALESRHTSVYVGCITEISSQHIIQEIEPGIIVRHSAENPLPPEVGKMIGQMAFIDYKNGQLRLSPAFLKPLHNNSSTFGKIVAETSLHYIQAVGRLYFTNHKKEDVGSLRVGALHEIRYKDGVAKIDAPIVRAREF